MHPGCYNWCSIKFLHFHLTSFGLRNMAAVVVGKGCGGKPHPPCYLHQRQFPFKQTAMTVAEFVCMVSIFCIVLPKFVIAMTIIL